MIPPLLDEQINSRLAGVPQMIPITQMISYASFLINKPKKLPDYVSFRSSNNNKNFETIVLFKKEELNSG